MNKKQINILVGCTILSLTILISLYALSPLSKEVYRGQFTRDFQEDVLVKSVLDIEYNSFYIAGMEKNEIYLGNFTAPLHLLKANTSLLDTQHVKLTVKLDSIRQPGRLRLVVASPYFFLTHGTEPQILRGTIGKWIAAPIMLDSGYYFMEAVPISATTFALRCYSAREKGYEIAKKNLDSLYFNNNLLVKQIDGVFCVDGRLHFSDSLKQLVYLHYYRNEFIIADTTLTLKYRSHTIDTFTRAMIKVANLNEGSQSMMAAPPAQINGLSCVNGKNLFVQSAVMAANDDPESFMNGSTIDVYDLTTGKYSKSFYIPNYKNQNLKSFQVIGDRLFAVLGNYLIRYDFIN